MRQRALEADVVVVNHHLLCADLAVKDGSYGSVIPAYTP
jgi:ATP-dependent DNA helicase DinG